MMKKCLKYKKNPACEGKFWVDSRVYARKKYCANCQRLKENEYMKVYQAEQRAKKKLNK
jgi:hypothetical protein